MHGVKVTRFAISVLTAIVIYQLPWVWKHAAPTPSVFAAFAWGAVFAAALHELQHLGKAKGRISAKLQTLDDSLLKRYTESRMWRLAALTCLYGALVGFTNWNLGRPIPSVAGLLVGALSAALVWELFRQSKNTSRP